jgi:cell division protease FtsH
LKTGSHQFAKITDEPESAYPQQIGICKRNTTMDPLSAIGGTFFGLVLASIAWALVLNRRRKAAEKSTIASLLKKHFYPTPLDNITISQRQFPTSVRADLQRAIDKLFAADIEIAHLCGVHKEYAHQAVTLTHCISQSGPYPAVSSPPQYEEIDIGEEQPVRALKAYPNTVHAPIGTLRA